MDRQRLTPSRANPSTTPLVVVARTVCWAMSTTVARLTWPDAERGGVGCLVGGRTAGGRVFPVDRDNGNRQAHPISPSRPAGQASPSTTPSTTPSSTGSTTTSATTSAPEPGATVGEAISLGAGRRAGRRGRFPGRAGRHQHTAGRGRRLHHTGRDELHDRPPARVGRPGLPGQPGRPATGSAGHLRGLEGRLGEFRRRRSAYRVPPGDPGRFAAGQGAPLPPDRSLSFGDYRCRTDASALVCVNYARQTAVRYSDDGIDAYGCTRQTPPAPAWDRVRLLSAEPFTAARLSATKSAALAALSNASHGDAVRRGRHPHRPRSTSSAAHRTWKTRSDS